MDWTADLPALPAVPGTLPTFEAKLQRLLDKLDALPVAEALADARTVMEEARSALAGVKTLAANVDRDALPSFVATMEDLRRSLDSARRVMDDTSATLVGPDAPGQRELRAALVEVGRAAKAARTLANSIERHPASLVWGRWGRDAQPEADPRYRCDLNVP